MRYVPDQDPCEMRLDHEHVELLIEALSGYRTKYPRERFTVSLIISALPHRLPYDVNLYPKEWEVVSRALRPSGSNPAPGTKAARYYALYQRMRRYMVFQRARDANAARA